jgi:3-oxoacyl-[acyl-carrier protein] reductase
MDLGLNGKRALVGGGSKGLGLACAQALLAEGCRVAIVSRSAENLRRGWEALGNDDRAKPICADLATASGVEACVAQARDWGAVDILVNNTGGPPPGGLLEHTEAAWSASHEALFLFVRRMVEAFVPAMRERKWGRVITITSIVAREPAPGLALSVVYRSAATAYLKMLAREIAADGVTVNTIMPGSFLTERTAALMDKRAAAEGRTREDILASRCAALPQRRCQEPAELGALVAFLASRPAGGITGTNIPVDGGMLAGI